MAKRLKLFGITYLVGKKKPFRLFFQRPGRFSVSSQDAILEWRLKRRLCRQRHFWSCLDNELAICHVTGLASARPEFWKRNWSQNFCIVVVVDIFREKWKNRSMRWWRERLTQSLASALHTWGNECVVQQVSVIGGDANKMAYQRQGHQLNASYVREFFRDPQQWDPLYGKLPIPFPYL